MKSLEQVLAQLRAVEKERLDLPKYKGGDVAYGAILALNWVSELDPQTAIPPALWARVASRRIAGRRDASTITKIVRKTRSRL